jgi:N-acetylmuramoyl-L-alanine amidase
MKFFAIAGHSDAQPGAQAWNSLFEHHYTSEMQELMGYQHRIEKLEGTVVFDARDLSLRQVITYIRDNYKPGDMVLDIHFNNNNPQATGTEILIDPRAGEKLRKIAAEIARGTSRITGLRLRQHVPQRVYKYPQDLGRHLAMLHDLAEAKIPAMIWEICFLNRQDMALYEPKKIDLARMVIQTLKDNYKSFD